MLRHVLGGEYRFPGAGTQGSVGWLSERGGESLGSKKPPQQFCQAVV